MMVQAEKQLHLNHSLLQAQNLDLTTGGQACMARAMIRTILLLTKKQAKGREKHHYQDLAEIATTFGQEFKVLVQKPEAASSSQGPAPAGSASCHRASQAGGHFLCRVSGLGLSTSPLSAKFVAKNFPLQFSNAFYFCILPNSAIMPLKSHFCWL